MVPKLRFKSFSAPLEKHKIEDILARFVSPVSVSKIEKYREIGIRSHGRGLFHKEELSGFELGNKRVFWIKKDAIIFNIVFAWEQAVAITSSEDEGCIASHRFPMYLPKDYKCNTDYIRRYFLTKKGKYLLELASPGGAGRNKTLGQKNFDELVVTIPDVTEQSKIADFLSSVDEKITLLNKQFGLLCQYKKGITQKIFSQGLRFKDERENEFSEWEYIELKEIASKVNIKNRDNSVNVVLTNSATQGIISQDSYFEREIVTESNLAGYYVVSVGDFVYNPRISATAPVGPVKMNELIQGVMSPLYTVFRFKRGSLNFYKYFFESSVWHDYMKSVANSGARHDRMNISGADFFGLPIPQPTEEEQIKIANFLSALDDKIGLKKAELDKLKIWKQGLLQQMFI
ncbi:restriction endonuclease subunit S [Kluyvera sp. CRP]|uniref:restriction endonuclease subunit S n=1 Tax=Kluyvera sp. CRP TaxID=2873269 RepID=UPI001CC1F0E7|nr:restriction endonuclease subunit S [Kluyvera sp. CRP]UAK22574.1 restriction endonuclease subunit S [Kluyvera sp. CRP]